MPIVDEVRLDAADVVDGSPAATVIDLPRVSPNFAPITRAVSVDGESAEYNIVCLDCVAGYLGVICCSLIGIVVVIQVMTHD